MCNVLAFIAAFICGFVTIAIGSIGLLRIDLYKIFCFKAKWIEKLLFFLIILVGLYAILVLFVPCPLPIH